MSLQNSQVIQNKQTIVSVGDSVNLSNTDTLVISVSGTSTSFSIIFQGSLNTTDYFSIAGTKLLDNITSSATTSTMGEAWEFDVSALTRFQASIVAIANGNVSVTANIITN